MADDKGEPGFTFLFAALGVADIAASAAWYERLLGRAPDLVPNKREAAWQLTDTGWIYVVAGDERAGRTLVTILVGDLDDLVVDPCVGVVAIAAPNVSVPGAWARRRLPTCRRSQTSSRAG